MSTPLVISVTDELVAELEALASKATGGEWEYHMGLIRTMADSDGYVPVAIAPNCPSNWRKQRDRNMNCIATANPATILALLAERAELLRDAWRWRWLRDKAVLSTETAPAILLVNDCCEPAVNGTGWQSVIHGKDADIYVDAAMQSEAKP